MPIVRLVGRRSRRLVLPALVAGSFLALAGGPLPTSLPAAAQPAGGTHVSMKDFAFMPASVTVKAGTTVTWSYDESVTDPMPNCETVVLSTQCPGHTATAMDKGANGKALFDSGTLKKPSSTYSFTFTAPGTYQYYCVYHGGTTATGKNNPITNMNGTIVVEAAATTPASANAPGAAAAAGAQVKGASSAAGAGTGLANTGGPALMGLALPPLAAGLYLRRRSLRRRRG
jgi:plastocyanin